jgi:hypothetical protein
MPVPIGRFGADLRQQEEPLSSAGLQTCDTYISQHRDAVRLLRVRDRLTSYGLERGVAADSMPKDAIQPG